MDLQAHTRSILGTGPRVCNCCMRDNDIRCYFGSLINMSSCSFYISYKPPSAGLTFQLGYHPPTSTPISVKMTDRLAFLLFGDQSLDTHGFLADFIRRGNQGILAKTFLEQSGRALCKEVEGLSATDRVRLPVFRSLSQLNEKYHAQPLKHPGVDGALLCVSQLAHYIEYVQSKTRPYLSAPVRPLTKHLVTLRRTGRM